MAATSAQDSDARPHFPSLHALYGAMRRSDTPPPGFSDELVPGEGPVGAPVMLIGEQPGEREDAAGRPFVGPAGRVLDECLAAAGIDRGRTFVTNAVKRFKFSLRGKRRLHRSPTAGDIAHYRWWLEEEIRLVDPLVLVALGATALHALSGRRQALGPVRGRILPWQERLMLATVHPGFLLHQRDEDARKAERLHVVEDLRQVSRLLIHG